MEGVDAVDDVVGDVGTGALGIVTDDQPHGDGGDLAYGRERDERRLYEG